MSKAALAKVVGGDGDIQRPILKIVTTARVQVTVMKRSAQFGLFGKDSTLSCCGGRTGRWEVDHIHYVLPQGTPIEPGPGWRRLDWYPGFRTQRSRRSR
jgi:hypothetical protein